MPWQMTSVKENDVQEDQVCTSLCVCPSLELACMLLLFWVGKVLGRYRGQNNSFCTILIF